MRTIAIAALLVSAVASASAVEGGRGMLFGKDHGFAVTASPGWVIDNRSGIDQGLHMLFYPEGETWADSPVIIYGRSIPLVEVATVKLHVEQTLDRFHANGSPDYVGEVRKPLTQPNGRMAEVYYFSGDKWGNYEAAAYFKETDTINYVVFNSRTKANFDKYIEDFHKIVHSYENLYASPTTMTNDLLDRLKSSSSLLLTEAGGKEYESEAVQAVGQTMANAMADCTSYTSGKELPAFSYFVRIDDDGSITDSWIFPTNALSACFSGLMSSARYPAHTFESFILNIEMQVAP